MISDVLPKLAALLFSDVICRGNPDAVYLTFDDGPDPVLTPELLEILSKLDCRASFFVTGSRIERHPETIRDISRHGHVVASHGFDHVPFTFRSYRDIVSDLQRSRRVISDVTGKQVNLFRPPYGRLGFHGLRAARQLGMTIVLWSLSPADYRSDGSETIVRRVLKGASKGDIVLLHDGKPGCENTLKAVTPIINGLRDRGFNLKTL